MAIKVGIYDQPQVRAQAAPSARMGNLPASGLQAVGEGLSQVANTMEQVDQKEFARVAEARMADAQTQLYKVDAQLNLDRQKLEGENALKPTAEGKSPFAVFDEKRAAAVDAITKGLGNQMLQDKFKSHAAAEGAKFEIAGKTYQDQQQKVFEQRVTDGIVTTAHDVIATDPHNDATFNEQANRALTALAGSYSKLGLPDEQVTALTAKAQSSLFATRLESLLNTDAVKAKQLLTDNPDALVGEQRRTVTNMVNVKFTATAGDTLADKLFNPDGTLADQLKALRSEPMAKGNPDVLKAGEAALKDRWSVRDFDRKEKVSSATDKIDGMVNTGKLSSANHGIYNAAVGMGMPEKEASALQIYWESNDRAKIMHNRQLAALLTPEQQKRNSDAMDAVFADPIKFARTPRSELDTLRSQLPPAQWQQVLEVHRRLINDPQLLKDMTVDSKEVAIALKGAGFIHDENPTGDAERALVTGAQGYVVQRLNDLRSQGVKITPELRQTEVTNAVTKSIADRKWFGLRADPKAPFQVAPGVAMGVPKEFAEAYTKEFGTLPAKVVADAYRRNPNLLLKRTTAAPDTTEVPTQFP